ncbi:TlpA family protein disulfide reductase [Geothrix oryzisoli]|uniref:TlpA family protein disulfide reductase n=1 Tax=Geothrix oryzisoli TaxID=2922721 RepID=UPI001FAC0591|nr:TlpA disulfide reductase family protein [Geothrix oryzisoli]
MFRALLALVLCISFSKAGDTEHFPIGKRPDVSKLGFVDQNGKKVLVEDFKGKIILVDFWTVWCGPCRRSLPEIHALQKQGIEKGTLVVIPCNLDDEYWPRGVIQFLNKNKESLPGFIYYRAQIGKNGIGTNLGGDINSYPTTLLIDRTGKLATKWSGYGEGLILYELNLLLNEKP